MTTTITEITAERQTNGHAEHIALLAANLEANGLPAFERLGNLVRALHDTLEEIGADAVLIEAAQDFPPARERLLHIASLTERAANVVLSKVEECVPIQESLIDRAAALLASWSPDQLPSAEQAAELHAFLLASQSGGKDIRHALSDMMMAQDFQDLTGQLIKKVVSLMERTESELLRLLLDSIPPDRLRVIDNQEIMAGPGAPGSIALDQSDVDSMLADLGF
jgi:chemotaxis protein CheZ